MIDSKTFVENVLRTDTPITPELLERLQNPRTVRLIHAAMGLATESAELMDMLKKHIFYGRPIDWTNAKEEGGDSTWYIGLLCDVLEMSFDELMTMVINKLKLRYPTKFSESDAINRNIETERKFLEDFKPVETVLSKRAKDWIKFSDEVLHHIENYTVPQYGDKGEDQITEWSIEECLLAIKKRQARYGKNVRDGQQILDFLKMAHETQIACDKYKEKIDGSGN
jgi:NTP pyrophosphatase (non-canonical NTP hydrolase)